MIKTRKQRRNSTDHLLPNNFHRWVKYNFCLKPYKVWKMKLLQSHSARSLHMVLQRRLSNLLIIYFYSLMEYPVLERSMYQMFKPKSELPSLQIWSILLKILICLWRCSRINLLVCTIKILIYLNLRTLCQILKMFVIISKFMMHH